MQNQDWFLSRKWGMFNHYIGLAGNGTFRTDFVTHKSFNDRVNAFNAENYAKTVHEINAGYVVFTIMQGEQFMCAPNDTFNRITGYRPGEACSERDLIADILSALDKYDIPLLLYFTGDGPHKDPLAGERFGYADRENEQIGLEFVEKWTAVLKEYAVRYGEKVKGWWLDGMSMYFGYDGHDDDFLKAYADAVKAGNPDALIAFNNGVIVPDYKNPAYRKFYQGKTNPMHQIGQLARYAQAGNEEAKAAFITPGSTYRYSKYENYTAGESNAFEELPERRFIDGSQWHILSFLGTHQYYDDIWGIGGWNALGCEYNADYMTEYVQKCNGRGGVVSIDTCLFDDGHIDWGQYEVLKKVGELRK